MPNDADPPSLHAKRKSRQIGQGETRQLPVNRHSIQSLLHSMGEEKPVRITYACAQWSTSFPRN
eukprot:917978-Prorocentrum_lima.AAC.1